MSLKTTKDEIYLATPGGKYQNIITPWETFMEEDFTLYTRAKVLIDDAEVGKDCFIIARNGQHAGISAYVDEEKNVLIGFTYWFWENGITPIQKKITHVLLPKDKNQFNEYLMICNHKEQEIYCYINETLVGTIGYKGLDKCSYKETYLWLGCGTMMMEEEYRNIGSFEYNLLLCAGAQFTLQEIANLRDNYKKFYTKQYSDYPILNAATPRREDIYFFTDFNHRTKYKIWNLAFNGCFFQFYIENNVMF